MADELDRSEQPTGKHRGEARSRGQIARSMEVNSEAVIVAGLVALAWIGPVLGHQLMEFTRRTLLSMRYAALDIPDPINFFFSSAAPVVAATALWMGVILGAALIAGFSQAGFEFASEALSLKWSSLNPISGFQRLFSWESMVRAIAAVLKITVIFLACRGIFRDALAPESLGRASSPAGLVGYLMDMALALGWRVALVLGVIAAADYVYQRWRHEKSLKMTKDEVKDEGKQSEPNPQVRSKIRGIMRRRHLERMARAVPRATVIITNPTHIAVALRYDRANMKAPRVVAKGLRLMAERIKEIARAHDIPIIEDKPLARGLYRHCPVGSEIPSAFYQMVAVILAQVFRLGAKKQMAETQASQTAQEQLF